MAKQIIRISWDINILIETNKQGIFLWVIREGTYVLDRAKIGLTGKAGQNKRKLKLIR